MYGRALRKECEMTAVRLYSIEEFGSKMIQYSSPMDRHPALLVARELLWLLE